VTNARGRGKRGAIGGGEGGEGGQKEGGGQIASGEKKIGEPSLECLGKRLAYSLAEARVSHDYGKREMSYLL